MLCTFANRKTAKTMRNDHKDDKFFLIPIDGGTREGYLRRMKRCASFPKEGSMLAVAFGHDGKIRLGNALGHMTPFSEAATLEELPEAAAGKYNLIAAYYVVENLDDMELPTFFHHIFGLLLAGGSLMVVVNLKNGAKELRRLRKACKEQGLSEVHTVLWHTEPLNTWDHRGNDGRALPDVMKHIPLLWRMRARSASVLLRQGQM